MSNLALNSSTMNGSVKEREEYEPVISSDVYRQTNANCVARGRNVEFTISANCLT